MLKLTSLFKKKTDIDENELDDSDEDARDAEDAGDAEDTGGASDAPPSDDADDDLDKKDRRKPLMIAAAGALVLFAGIAGGAGWWYFIGDEAGSAKTAAETTVKTRDPSKGPMVGMPMPPKPGTLNAFLNPHPVRPKNRGRWRPLPGPREPLSAHPPEERRRPPRSLSMPARRAISAAVSADGLIRLVDPSTPLAARPR